MKPIVDFRPASFLAACAYSRTYLFLGWLQEGIEFLIRRRRMLLQRAFELLISLNCCFAPPRMPISANRLIEVNTLFVKCARLIKFLNQYARL